MTTEQLEKELGADAVAIATEPWRLLPHTFADEVGLRCGGIPFKRTQLADYLCEIIADAVMQTGARIIINVAPRQGKSEAVSFVSPTWFLEHFPNQRVILASHTAALALQYGRRIRDEFSRNEHLTTRLKEDAQAANHWITSDGGELKTIGVGGGLLGFGGNLNIIDDPHKGWVEAQSATKRKNVIDWFEGTVMGRLEPGASVAVVGQRLHRDDLTGHLLKNSKEKWTLIRLPALAHENDPMGRMVGEAVCPERFSTEEMRSKQVAMPRAMWAAMFDQDPDESKEGRTYSGYSSDNVKSEPETKLRTDLPVFVTFDFNVNPGMHAEIGQSHAREDKIIFRHEIHGPRMKTPACAKAVAKKLLEYGDGKFIFAELVIYGDRSGKTENTQTSESDYAIIRKEFADAGISPVKFDVPEANPPRKERIAAVNDALLDSEGVCRLLVHPDCVRLVADFENVEDGEDGFPDVPTGSPFTHPSDAVGYATNRIRPMLSPVEMNSGYTIHVA